MGFVQINCTSHSTEDVSPMDSKLGILLTRRIFLGFLTSLQTFAASNKSFYVWKLLENPQFTTVRKKIVVSYCNVQLLLLLVCKFHLIQGQMGRKQYHSSFRSKR